MPVNRDRIGVLVRAAMASIDDAPLKTIVAAHLLQPELVRCTWDYGTPDFHDCWIVAAAPHWKQVRIVFCDEGFGPRSPWGLIFTPTEEVPVPSMGQDSGWFPSLEAVFRDCLSS